MSSGEEGYESDHFEDDHDEIEEHISSRKGSMVSYPGLARNLIAETHEMGTPFQPPAPGEEANLYKKRGHRPTQPKQPSGAGIHHSRIPRLRPKKIVPQQSSAVSEPSKSVASKADPLPPVPSQDINLKQENSRLRRRLKSLEEKLKKEHSQPESARDQPHSSRSAILPEAYQAERVRLRNALAQKDTELKTAQRQVESQSRQIMDLKKMSTLSVEDDKVMQLMNEKKTVQLAMKQLKDENRALMNVQRNMEKRLTSNSSLGEAIPARIRTLNAEIRNLKQQLKASKDAERKAAKALKRQHASVVSLTEQHRQASHDVQELKVKASNSKIGRKLAQLQKQYDQTAEELRNMKSELATEREQHLRDQKAASSAQALLSADVRDLKEALEDAEEVIRAQKLQLSLLTRENRSVAAGIPASTATAPTTKEEPPEQVAASTSLSPASSMHTPAGVNATSKQVDGESADDASSQTAHDEVHPKEAGAVGHARQAADDDEYEDDFVMDSDADDD